MITTDRLLLRPYEIGDYETYVTLAGQEQRGSLLSVFSREDCWHRLLRFIGHWSAFGWGLFAVFDRDGSYLGETGLADFHRGLGEDFDTSPEGAWNFLPAAQGKGVAFEATRAAHDWFAREHGPRRTVCMIQPVNVASIRLAERLGYSAFRDADYKGMKLRLFERQPKHAGISTTGAIR